MNKFFLFIALFAILISCSKEEIKESNIKEKSLDLQVLEAYQEGVQNLEAGDVLLITGKGHETGQIIGDSVLDFDDAEQANIVVSALEGAI